MSKNPFDKDYDQGLYNKYNFNSMDFIIRKDLGLYAKELIPEERLIWTLRGIVKNSSQKFAILPASQLLPEMNEGVYILYIPIKKLAQRKPKCTVSSKNNSLPSILEEAGERSNAGHPFS